MSWQVPENSVKRQLQYSRGNVSFVLFSARAGGLHNCSNLAGFWPPYSQNSDLKVYNLLYLFFFSLDSRRMFLRRFGCWNGDEIHSIPAVWLRFFIHSFINTSGIRWPVKDCGIKGSPSRSIQCLNQPSPHEEVCRGAATPCAVSCPLCVSPSGWSFQPLPLWIMRWHQGNLCVHKHELHSSFGLTIPILVV